MKKDLTVKTLHKVVDWIVNESCEDTCGICAYYPLCADENTPYDYPDDIEPCPYKRENGCKACRNGIIEHFQSEVQKCKTKK